MPLSCGPARFAEGAKLGGGRREFPDEGPGNFRDLAVVVVDGEAGVAPILDLQMIELSCRSDAVGLADSPVGFKDAETVLKLHVEGILPT